MPVLSKVVLLSSLLLFVFGCTQKNNVDENSRFAVNPVQLIEKSIEILDSKTFPGFVLGANFKNNEFFLDSRDYAQKNRWALKIVDIISGSNKRSLFLERGTFQSPKLFFAPGYMDAHIDAVSKKYYVVDRASKVAAFHENLTFDFSSMFYDQTYFVDIFPHLDKTLFICGLVFWKSDKWHQVDINLYELIRGRRPILLSTLHSFDLLNHYYKTNQTDKYWYQPSYWASSMGFEKNGKIIYSMNTEPRIYIYSIAEKHYETIELKYLEGRKYTEKEGEKIGSYKFSEKERKEHQKKIGMKFLYQTYPEPIYHLGLYDVGKNKIGIIGEFYSDSMRCRMDVFNLAKKEYLESIWFPVGYGFKFSLEQPGLRKSYFNVDQNVYLWEKMDDEGENYTLLSKFKLINQTQ